MLKIGPGPIRKMVAKLNEQGVPEYQLPIGDELLPLNDVIGKELTLTFHNKITCSHCGKNTRKSYSQGFCFPCMQKLPQCDMCIMKPETCHYDKGTCRDPQWGESNCMIKHYVYLSNTSGLKVGITRHSQIPTRWIDQGATQALPLLAVSTRLQSGLVETELAQHIADKTNWRAMLKGQADAIDLKAKAKELLPLVDEVVAELRTKYGDDAITVLDENVVEIDFPVTDYLTKISSFNFDKTPEVTGMLQGIKGQYLIFEHGVINMRKFTSYHVSAQVN